MIVWTFRNEPRHLNWDYGQDPYQEYELFYNLGIDGYFTDFPASLKRYFDYKSAEHHLGKKVQKSETRNKSLTLAKIIFRKLIPAKNQNQYILQERQESPMETTLIAVTNPLFTFLIGA